MHTHFGAKKVFRTYKIYLVAMLLSILLTCLCQSHDSYAENNLKIGVVNIEKVFHESKVTKDIMSQFSAKRSEFGKEARDLQEQFNNKRRDIERSKSAINEDVYKSKIDELNKEMAAMQKKALMKNEVLEKGHEDSIEKVLAQLEKIIADKAKEKKLTMVIDKSSVRYLDNELDITEEVIKDMNKSMAKLEVNFAQYDKLGKM